jgi:hypothetical protein
METSTMSDMGKPPHKLPNAYGEALLIADSFSPYVGLGRKLKPKVAKAVAYGIALGRKEGLQLAAKLIADALKKADVKES